MRLPPFVLVFSVLTMLVPSGSAGRAQDAQGATPAPDCAYFFFDPPLSSFSEVAGATVTLTGAGGDVRLTLTVPANPTAGQQVYEFKEVAKSPAPSG